MVDVSAASFAKRAVKALHDGELNPHTSYKLFTRIALEQFPDSKNEAEATEKFRQTVHGQEWFNAERQHNYAKMQTDHALSANESLIKAFGNPASRQSAFEIPSVTRPSGAPTLNAGSIPWPIFNRAVELLMAAKNCSRDAAISAIYRAEKSLKNFSDTPHESRSKPQRDDDDGDSDPRDRDDFSSGGQRRRDNHGSREMTSASLNDGAKRAANVDSAVKAMMGTGMSYDAAITKVHRIERGY